MDFTVTFNGTEVGSFDLVDGADAAVHTTMAVLSRKVNVDDPAQVLIKFNNSDYGGITCHNRDELRRELHALLNGRVYVRNARSFRRVVASHLL